MTTASLLFAPVTSYTPDSVLVTNASGMVTAATNPVQAVEYAYGTTSDVQAQIDTKETLLSGNELSSVDSVPLLGPGNISLDGVPFLCMVRDPNHTLSTNSSYIRPDGRWTSLKNSPRLKNWLGKPTRRPEVTFLGRLPFRNASLPSPVYDQVVHDGTYFISWNSDHQFFYSLAGDYWTAGLPPKWPANSNYICIDATTNTWIATFYHGVGDSGVKISTDKGTTWTTRTHKYFTEDNFWSACGIANGYIVLADYNSNRIAYSSNLGVSWQYGYNMVTLSPSYAGMYHTIDGALRSMYSPPGSGLIVGVEAGSAVYPQPTPPNADWNTNHRQELYWSWFFTPGSSTSFSGRHASIYPAFNQEFADQTGTVTINGYSIAATGAYASLNGKFFPYDYHGSTTVDYRYPFSFGNGRAPGKTLPSDYQGYCHLVHPNIQMAFVEPGVGGYFATTGDNWEFFSMPKWFSSSATIPADSRLINGNSGPVTITGTRQIRMCASTSGNIVLMINPAGEYIVFNTTLKNPTEARIPNIVGDVGTGGDYPPPDTCLKII